MDRDRLSPLSDESGALTVRKQFQPNTAFPRTKSQIGATIKINRTQDSFEAIPNINEDKDESGASHDFVLLNDTAQ